MNRREVVRLLGAAVTIPIFSGLSAEQVFAVGQQAHSRLAAGAGTDRWIFETLDAHQNETVTVIAELIIPQTDTPGAKAARVNRFIDLILTHWADGEQRAQFLKGLADIDARSQESYNKNFVDCAESEQVDILKAVDAEAMRDGVAADKNWGRDHPSNRHYFQVMKWLTLVGYYTSDIGLRQELKYQVIPGKYVGCVPTEASVNLQGKTRH